MKKFAFLLSLLVSFGALAQNRTKEYHISVGPFDKIIVENNINVVFSTKKDSIGYINYTCTPDLADAVIASCKDGKLKIQLEADYTLRKDLPTVYVYSNYLTYVNNSSDSTFTAREIPENFRFEVKQVGNGTINVPNVVCTEAIVRLSTGKGNINISGKCESAKIFMIGTGVIQADLLQANSVECKILGGGAIGCDPRNALTVKGIGSTKIYYRSEPPVIKKTGGGKLIPLSNSSSERL